MNRKNIIVMILLCMSAIKIETTNNIITFFIKKYPTVQPPGVESPELLQQDEQNNQISKAVTQPDFLNPKKDPALKNTPGASGIYAFYKGYSQTSSFLGQITFPRKQQSETVYLIVTETISPEFIVGPSTVGYWKIDSTSPTAVYEMAIDYDDDANTYYVNTTKIDAPENNQISLQSIVIIGNPDNVYVPEGATIAEFTANLTLPTIYIKDTFDQSKNASYALSLKNYFAGLNETFQQNDLIVSKLMSEI